MLPVLRLNDVGLGGSTESVPLGPWETLLTAVGTLTPTSAGVLARRPMWSFFSGSAGTRRRSAPRRCISRPRWRRSCSQMHDDMLVVVVVGVPQYLWFATTPVEDQMLGSPAAATAPR